MHISVLAYDGCLAAEVFGIADVLLIANRISQAKSPHAPLPFDVAVISARNRPVQAAGGVTLGVQRAAARTELLVIPAFDVGPHENIDRTLARLQPEVALIVRAAARHPVATVCGGSFLLGEAGLLHERRATTAWAFAPELARRYPTAIVEPDALLVRDGGITTSGAFSASADLALHIIRAHASAGLARAVGRLALIDAGRSSQAAYIDARVLARGGEPFSQKVTRWLESRLALPYSLERLSQAFNVSSRTLLRRYKAETGRSPLEQLQELRVLRARQLLESTGLGLGQIAEKVGYRDLSTFARLFVRKSSVTPAAYRRRFKAAQL